MEKIIKEYYCDYCGKKCKHTEFILPEYRRIETMDKSGNILKTENIIKNISKDICPECQEKIVALLGLMESVNIVKGLTEINFK